MNALARDPALVPRSDDPLRSDTAADFTLIADVLVLYGSVGERKYSPRLST